MNFTRVLGQEIAIADHFAQHNVDSLAALELSIALSKSIGKELPSTLIFDFPSVNELGATPTDQILSPKMMNSPGVLCTHIADLVVPRQEG